MYVPLHRKTVALLRYKIRIFARVIKYYEVGIILSRWLAAHVAAAANPILLNCGIIKLFKT